MTNPTQMYMCVNCCNAMRNCKCRIVPVPVQIELVNDL